MADTGQSRFHWSLSAVGDASRRGQAQVAMSGAFDLDTHTAFCRAAEQCGIDSLLMAFGSDPFTWSAALGSRTFPDTPEVLAERIRPVLDSGTPAISLVGSADDMVDAILSYRDVGITEFLFTGFPDLEQMRFFAAKVLPRVRERERASVSTPTG